MLDHDPKLKEAMCEITAIMRKHDIGGHIILSSKSHAEFRFEPPKWSAVTIDDEIGIRVRTNSDLYPNKEAKRAALESSVHFLESVGKLSKIAYDSSVKLLSMIIEAGVSIEFSKNPIVPDRKN